MKLNIKNRCILVMKSSQAFSYHDQRIAVVVYGKQCYKAMFNITNGSIQLHYFHTTYFLKRYSHHSAYLLLRYSQHTGQ